MTQDDASAGAVGRGWLFSARADLSVILLPFLLAGVGYGIEWSRGTGRVIEREYALYLSQFLLGNTTHVILTFLALGARRDLLSPVPGQKSILVYGSLAAFLAACGLFWGTSIAFPRWVDFGATIGFIFAQHHRLAQIKGVWALYSLRAKQPPSRWERVVQNHFVALMLLALVGRMLLFPRALGTHGAQLSPIPGFYAPLPFEGVYVLLGLFAIGGAIALWLIFKAGATFAKKLYLTAHVLALLFTLYSPLWGAVITSGIHGLEYYYLTARMLETKDGDAQPISTAKSWGLMFLAMAPLIVVGSLQAPFARGVIAQSQAVRVAIIALNGVVMAHYFADAFMYRLRLPDVRRVVLHRLGFATR